MAATTASTIAAGSGPGIGGSAGATAVAVSGPGTAASRIWIQQPSTPAVARDDGNASDAMDYMRKYAEDSIGWIGKCWTAEYAGETDVDEYRRHGKLTHASTVVDVCS